MRNASRRHLQDLAEGPKRGLVWDLKAALWAINFFPDVLHLAAGEFEGAPFHLLGWQKFIVGSLFGWKRKDGRRRFKLGYIETAKGSGKTPMAAGIGHLGLLADHEPRAEVYAAASKKDQAMVLFRAAVAMRDQSPALRHRLTKTGGEINPWQLTDIRTGSFFKPLSSEDGQSGPLPHIGLVDELHEHRDRTMLSMLRKGHKSRNNALTLIITNSGSDPKSVCGEEHDRAVKVAAGTRTPDDVYSYVGEVLDDEVFAYVCALDKGEDPLEDEGCWPKANPSLHDVLSPDYIRTQVEDAKAIPGNLNETLRLNFCIWTDAANSWITRAALNAVLADFDPAEHAGKEIFTGDDLSDTTDLTARAYVVKTGTVEVERIVADGSKVTSVEPTFDAWIEAWTPEEGLTDRVRRDNAPYDVWIKQQHLQTTPGPMVKLGFVAASLARAAQQYRIRFAAYDRYAFRKYQEECDALGVTVEFVEHPQGGKRRAPPPDSVVEAAKRAGAEPPQGLWMPGSVVELERVILDRRIRLRRNPVLVGACMSAVLERDAFGNKWFSKRKATNRIDAAVALAMGVGVATAGFVVDQGSVYEKRGILMV